MGARSGWRSGQLTTVLRALRGRTVPPAPAGGDARGAADGVLGAGDGAGGAGDGTRGAGDGAARSPAASRVDAVAVAAAAARGALPPGALDGLDARRRAQVLAPLDVPAGRTLRWGSAAARQVDGTTCGAAVLGLLAAAGDPRLALWLVSGRLPAGPRPPELAGLDLPEPANPHHPDAPTWFRTPDGRVVHASATGEEAAAARWGLLQAALHRRSTARAVAGVLPWPRSLGTPPWGAARVARFPGVRYRSVLVDDTRTAEVADLLARVDAALDRGIPVPLYSGGDLSGGPGAAVPRHVVLAVGRSGAGYRVYEPGAGAVLPLPRAALRSPSGPVPALGHWTHLAWALLPTPAR